MGSSGLGKRKPYSIASSPEDVRRDGCLELLVGLDADGTSGSHLSLEPGSLVDLDGPAGRFAFPDRPAASRLLFIAGGTGIAPVRSMLRHAINVPHETIGLMYSARRPEEFAYAEEFQRMADERAIELHMTVTRDAEPGRWAGPRGRISQAELERLVDVRDSLCFVCGPTTLVDQMTGLLLKLGVEPERVRVDGWS